MKRNFVLQLKLKAEFRNVEANHDRFLKMRIVGDAETKPIVHREVAMLCTEM